MLSNLVVGRLSGGAGKTLSERIAKKANVNNFFWKRGFWAFEGSPEVFGSGFGGFPEGLERSVWRLTYGCSPVC